MMRIVEEEEANQGYKGEWAPWGEKAQEGHVTTSVDHPNNYRNSQTQVSTSVPIPAVLT